MATLREDLLWPPPDRRRPDRRPDAGFGSRRRGRRPCRVRAGLRGRRGRPHTRRAAAPDPQDHGRRGRARRPPGLRPPPEGAGRRRRPPPQPSPSHGLARRHRHEGRTCRRVRSCEAGDLLVTLARDPIARPEARADGGPPHADQRGRARCRLPPAHRHERDRGHAAGARADRALRGSTDHSRQDGDRPALPARTQRAGGRQRAHRAAHARVDRPARSTQVAAGQPSPRTRHLWKRSLEEAGLWTRRLRDALGGPPRGAARPALVRRGGRGAVRSRHGHGGTRGLRALERDGARTLRRDRGAAPRRHASRHGAAPARRGRAGGRGPAFAPRRAGPTTGTWRRSPCARASVWRRAPSSYGCTTPARCGCGCSRSASRSGS